jgi:dTDP-4-dehydrorhamnose 3,5-epimerase
VIKTVINQNIPEVFELTPTVYEDKRGFFLETFSKSVYKDLGIDFDFVQDNHSSSKKDVLRGLHYQKEKPQGKLVRCVRGGIFDVAVDIRKGSLTFGMAVSTVLTSQNKKQFWIPPGFAHGFCVLSEVADFEYKCTEYYDPSSEGIILWSDADIDIPWPVKTPILSNKDAYANSLTDQ